MSDDNKDRAMSKIIEALTVIAKAMDELGADTFKLSVGDKFEFTAKRLANDKTAVN